DEQRTSYIGERRFTRYCDRAVFIGSHRGQYETKPDVCILVQRFGNSNCCRNTFSLDGLVVVANDRSTGNEPQLCIGDWKCPAVETGKNLCQRSIDSGGVSFEGLPP